MSRILSNLILVALLGACGAIASIFTHSTSTPPSTFPTIPSGSTTTPGLVVQGTVRLSDGTGLAGVTICRNYASYPGQVVATTDANGLFQSAFAGIPGDEMVGIWPMKEGYTFEPNFVGWRHYYGNEVKTQDFTAIPSTATAVPPGECH